MADNKKPELDTATRLNLDTAVIDWSELVRHFARGVVIKATIEVDLVDVATCMAEDNTAQMQTWLDAGVVTRASDDDARDWTAREPAFWCVVTAPWVLVQECKPDEGTLPANQTLH